MTALAVVLSMLEGANFINGEDKNCRNLSGGKDLHYIHVLVTLFHPPLHPPSPSLPTPIEIIPFPIVCL